MDRREFVATVAVVSAGLAVGAERVFASSDRDVSKLSDELAHIVMKEALQKRTPHDSPFFKYRMNESGVLGCEKAFVFDSHDGTIKEMTISGRGVLVPGVEIACNPEILSDTYRNLGYQDKVALANDYLDSIFRSEQGILNDFLSRGLTPCVYPRMDVVVLSAGCEDKVGVVLFENFSIAARIK
jgi:hypothetical protein